MHKLAKYYYHLAWLVSLVAMAGSLYYSEILHLTPCTLCWYQRIIMYPLVIILGIGIWRKNKDLYMYVLPFSIVGIGFATYHYLLQWGVVGENSGVCTSPVSCTDRFIDYFGFLTLPLMSLTAFLAITVFVWLAIRNKSK